YQQRQCQQEQTQADHNVERPLEEFVHRTATEAVGVEEPARLEGIEIDRPSFTLPKIEEIDHFNTGELAVQQLPDGQATALIGRHHALVGPKAIHNLGRATGFAVRPVDNVGATTRTLPPPPRDKRNRHKVLTSATLRQLGDTCRLCATAKHHDSALQQPAS